MVGCLLPSHPHCVHDLLHLGKHFSTFIEWVVATQEFAAGA